jgi:hypothetical protein
VGGGGGGVRDELQEPSCWALRLNMLSEVLYNNFSSFIGKSRSHDFLPRGSHQRLHLDSSIYTRYKLDF